MRPIICLKLSRVGEAIVSEVDPKKDEHVIIDYYKGLDEGSLYMRFMAVVKDVKRLVDEMISRGCRFVSVSVDGRVVGMGELCRERGECWAALSINRAYRKRGLGSILLFGMLCLSKDWGCSRILGDVLVFNDVGLRFFRRMGGVVDVIEDSVVRGHIPVEQGIFSIGAFLADKGLVVNCGSSCT